MIRHNLLSLCLVLLASTAMAAPREMTLYLDAAVVSYDVTAKKGLAELALPAAVREDSLRVKPLDGGSISRVTLVPARLPAKLKQEITTLDEQKNRLQDRLKALETREAIFTSAAKSQSSKAPRKSKTNPDPLASVRQGTDFAIAQLEAVYTTRRRTEQELKRVDARLAVLAQQPGSGPTVSVVVTPASARVRINAILAAGGWKPHYDIRLSGNGSARLFIFAELTTDIANHQQGTRISVVPARLTAESRQKSFPLQQRHGLPQVDEWQLPVTGEQFSSGPLNSFSFTLQNTGQVALPAGQVAIFRADEYVGSSVLPALTGGASATITGPR